MKLGDFIEQTLEDYHTRVLAAIKPLSHEEMTWRPDPESNSVAFIFWHVIRVEDRWTNTFAKDGQEVWLRGRWHEKLNMPKHDVGFGYSSEQLEGFANPPKEDLQEYFHTVRTEMLEFLRGLDDADFDAVPDRTPFPENTGSAERFRVFSLARMYRQLIGEEDQHLGQISYVRGLQRGLNK